ncbi:helix-turn-helix transcriptional regulator [bacterium]|nr:helix-turn-helix transcriptional regulator [bacterium]
MLGLHKQIYKNTERMINIKETAKEQGLKLAEVAKAVFPNNKYPVMALGRLQTGSANLRTTHVKVLAEILGVSEEEVITGKSPKWKGGSAGRGIVEFKRLDYKARLDIESGVTTLTKGADVVTATVVHTSAMCIEDYLAEMDAIIEAK